MLISLGLQEAGNACYRESELLLVSEQRPGSRVKVLVDGLCYFDTKPDLLFPAACQTDSGLNQTLQIECVSQNVKTIPVLDNKLASISSYFCHQKATHLLCAAVLKE